MPAGLPLGLAVTVRVPLSVPEVGMTASHKASSLTVQEREPGPDLVMVMVWVGMLVSPWVAENKREVGDTEMVGTVVTRYLNTTLVT